MALQAHLVYRFAMDRRAFLATLPLVAGVRMGAAAEATVQTVLGPVPAADLGLTLVHEHVLVDFIGADRVRADRYRADDVFRVALPFLNEAKRLGLRTLVECTPAYLGRDPVLLRRLAEATGLHILTNTGYYGAANDRYVPAHAWRASPDELAARWIAEARGGIDGTGIRPGFQKVGVDSGPLSEIDGKLVVAAARTHLATGLTIAVHTGDGVAARETLKALEREGVGPSAYVWVHAQNEQDRAVQVALAAAGAWVELDGVGPRTAAAHADAVADLTRRGHLGRLLVSQDAGWYHVGEPGGGSYRPYSFLLETFVPALRERGLTDAQVRTLLVENPARAFAIGVRRR
jgi:predicted metal-dependent phosphotriesterase family hydrolase